MTAADHANTVREALEGIDKDECEDDNGWWETSAGAKFGAERKAIILAALDALQAQADHWHETANALALSIDGYEDRAVAAEAERDRLADALREAGGKMPDPWHPRFPAQFVDRQVEALAIIDAALAGKDT